MGPFKPISSVQAALHEAISAALSANDPVVARIRASKRILVTSDTSETRKIKGDPASPTGQSTTVGLFITSFEDAMAWHHGPRKTWRDGLRFTNQKINFKTIKEKPDLQELNSFLRIVDLIPSIVATLTVPTNPKYVFTHSDDSKKHPNLEAYRNWKPLVFEDLMRMVNFLGSCIHIVFNSQEIMWISDNDAIIANEEMRISATGMVEIGLKGNFGCDVNMGLVPLELLDDQLAAEDLLAIPDIAAGGVCEYLERINVEYGRSEGVWVNAPTSMRGKVLEIARWLGMSRGRTHKVVLSLDPTSEKAYHQQIVSVPGLW